MVTNKRRRKAAKRVLLELSRIDDATLRSWITRHFATVTQLARAELARRALKEKR